MTTKERLDDAEKRLNILEGKCEYLEASYNRTRDALFAMSRTNEQVARWLRDNLTKT